LLKGFENFVGQFEIYKLHSAQISDSCHALESAIRDNCTFYPKINWSINWPDLKHHCSQIFVRNTRISVHRRDSRSLVVLVTKIRSLMIGKKLYIRVTTCNTIGAKDVSQNIAVKMNAVACCTNSLSRNGT
jgi:hypothetical protein